MIWGQHPVLWQQIALDFTVGKVGELTHSSALGGNEVSGTESPSSRDHTSDGASAVGIVVITTS